MAGAADVPLMGVPERAIRERSARFAETDDVPFTQQMHDRAVSRSGEPFDAARAGHRRRDDRPRRPLRDAARDARPQPGPHRRVAGRRRRAGGRRRRHGRGDHRPGGQPLHPRDVRATGGVPGHGRPAGRAAGGAAADRARAGHGRRRDGRVPGRVGRDVRPARAAHDRGTDGGARHAAAALRPRPRGVRRPSRRPRPRSGADRRRPSRRPRGCATRRGLPRTATRVQGTA